MEQVPEPISRLVPLARLALLVKQGLHRGLYGVARIADRILLALPSALAQCIKRVAELLGRSCEAVGGRPRDRWLED